MESKSPKIDTQKSIAEVKSRVKIIGWKEGVPIILLKELKQQSAQTTELLWDQAEYIANSKSFYLIVDVSISSPPSGKVRSAVIKKYENLRSLILFIYVYVGKNFLLKVTLKFIVAAYPTKDVQLIKDIQQGLDFIKNKS